MAGDAILQIKQDTVRVQFLLTEGISYKLCYIILNFEDKIILKYSICSL